MDSFLILLIVGLWAYGRAVRDGIISSIAPGSTAATAAQSNQAVQGPVPGGFGAIPNSNGTAPPPNDGPTIIFSLPPGVGVASGGSSSGSGIAGIHVARGTPIIAGRFQA